MKYDHSVCAYPTKSVFDFFSICNFQMEGSDQKFVTLGPLDLRSTGVYRCEVSAEGPSFASVSGEGRMTVVRKFACHSFLFSTFLFFYSKHAPKY